VESILISQYPGRIFRFSSAARFTGRMTVEGQPIPPLPARSIAVIVWPPEIPDAPQRTPKRDGYNDHWNGWYPQCKPGMESPWDKATWGNEPSVLPKNFSPCPPVCFSQEKAYPLGKNELFPIIKRTRTMFGRDFYGFVLLFEIIISGGIIGYTYAENYRLVGDFQDGYEGYPVIDIQGTAL